MMIDESLASLITRERDDYFGRFVHSLGGQSYQVCCISKHVLSVLRSLYHDGLPSAKCHRENTQNQNSSGCRLRYWCHAVIQEAG